MDKYIWLFPVLFMAHEMEEIVGLRFFLEKNRDTLESKSPRIAKTYRRHSTEGFALAVSVEYLLVIAVTLASALTGVYGPWIGAFTAVTLHLAVHIGQSLIVRKYVPAVATSVLTLPINARVIFLGAKTAGISPAEIALWTIAGAVVLGLDLKLVHILMGWFTEKTNARS